MVPSRFAGCLHAPCSRRGRATSPCAVGRRGDLRTSAVIEDSSSTSPDDISSMTSDQETASTATPTSEEPSAQPAQDPQSSALPVSEACEDRRAGRLSSLPQQAERSASMESNRMGWLLRARSRRSSSSLAQQAERSVSSESKGGAWSLRTKSRRSSRSAGKKLTSSNEAAQIKQLMQLMDPGQPLGRLSDFAKEYGDEVFCRRLLRKYEGNVPKVAGKFKHALNWREQNKELLATRQCVHGSDERVVAADLGGHPMVYLCLKNQMLSGSQCLDQKVVTMLQAIDNMPPGVQTAIHIWDLHGMKFRMSDLNPSPMLKMVQSLEGYFAERMQELIIIEMPRMALTLKDAIWSLVPEKTKNKVRFMTVEQAKEYMQAKCDSEVSSRIAAIMKENRDPGISLEERKRSWMRVNKCGELVPAFALA